MSSTHFKIYTRINELPESWDALVTHDVFLQTSFLNALEESCPSNITPFYVAFFKADELVGVAVIQRVAMYLDDVFRKTSDNKLKRLGKYLIAQIVRGNGLVVGNLMHTGQHGLFFNEEIITQDVFLEQIFKALAEISKRIKQQDHKKIRIIGFKDYFETDKIHNNAEIFQQKRMYKAKVQPNMLLTIKPHWITINDYAANLNKKYRRRYKTARKKSQSIVKRELTINEIAEASTELFKLYKNVSDNARVNSFVLNEVHFFNLKKQMQDRFKLFGYYLNEKLVGFYTLILNGEDLETYFLGYDKAYQSKHQMYLNMLFDMLSFAIENRFKTVVYARTAMEIKSSVGAKPNTMYIYMKHTNNSIANAILKFIVNTLNPIKKWEERHPFK